MQITVSQSGALNGHAKKHPDDIIPPFPGFSGQNWDAAGQATWNNGCVAPPSEQPIRVSATCIDAQGATYTARFGYESENVIERTIAVGTDNAVQPGGPGRGQPTVFQPGHVAEAFAVSGIPLGTTVTWTVRFAGATSAATASSATPPCNPVPPKPTTGVFVTCVQPRAGRTYDATFGYQNDEATAITVPIGPANAVTPGGPDRGQPSVFSPGRVDDAFTVTGVPQGAPSTWTVRGAGVERSATATVESPLCTRPPPPARPVGIFVKCIAQHADGTYDATFGYENPEGDYSYTVQYASPAGMTVESGTPVAYISVDGPPQTKVRVESDPTLQIRFDAESGHLGPTGVMAMFAAVEYSVTQLGAAFGPRG